jgi:hypothetical protein
MTNNVYLNRVYHYIIYILYLIVKYEFPFYQSSERKNELE